MKPKYKTETFKIRGQQPAGYVPTADFSAADRGILRHAIIHKWIRNAKHIGDDVPMKRGRTFVHPEDAKVVIAESKARMAKKTAKAEAPVAVETPVKAKVTRERQLDLSEISSRAAEKELTGRVAADVRAIAASFASLEKTVAELLAYHLRQEALAERVESFPAQVAR